MTGRVPLVAAVAFVIAALAALVFSIARAGRSGQTPPTPVGKPKVNDTVMQNLYRRTHPGMPMPGPQAQPAAPQSR